VPFGNFNDREAREFEELWEELDLIGAHAYLGWDFNSGKEAPRRETVFRALEQWTTFPVHKWLPTEGGFDRWLGDFRGGGNPGWRAIGLDEQAVTSAVVEVANALHQRGAVGYTWYCLRAQNDADWSNYYPTRRMLEVWRDALPPLRLPGTNAREPREPIVDPAVRFPTEFAEWRASGGIPNIDFLAWMAAVKGYQLTSEEHNAIVRSINGNVEALRRLGLSR
jgi:hypothetical protein